MASYQYFSSDDLHIVNNSVALAEELVSNHYKLSATQLLQLNYDVKTLADLSPHEIVDDHFAQIIRYAEKKKTDFPDGPVKDFYKVCLQDHSILKTTQKFAELDLYAFAVYIVCHELIHIIRFRKFLQHFDAPFHEKLDEEVRVHIKTHEILSNVKINHLAPVLAFYRRWTQAGPASKPDTKSDGEIDKNFFPSP
ncbi:MAG: hypothetical protein R2860_07690 [Desulfobacterales bacterium]